MKDIFKADPDRDKKLIEQRNNEKNSIVAKLLIRGIREGYIMFVDKKKEV